MHIVSVSSDISLFLSFVLCFAVFQVLQCGGCWWYWKWRQHSWGSLVGVEGINPVVGHTKGVFFLPHAETLYCHSWGNLPDYYSYWNWIHYPGNYPKPWNSHRSLQRSNSVCPSTLFLSLCHAHAILSCNEQPRPHLFHCAHKPACWAPLSVYNT